MGMFHGISMLKPTQFTSLIPGIQEKTINTIYSLQLLSLTFPMNSQQKNIRWNPLIHHWHPQSSTEIPSTKRTLPGGRRAILYHQRRTQHDGRTPRGLWFPKTRRSFSLMEMGRDGVPNVLDRSKMSVLLEANGLTNTWILVRMHNLCGRSLIFTN